MFIQKMKSEGISHLSYMLGSESEAIVIDPRLDTEIYHELAQQNEFEIKAIFETHRNEDYVVGSCQLARETGAQIYHGAALDFDYGQSSVEGDSFQFGNLQIKVLETPGHTFESLSYVLYDLEFSDTQAVGVFTGDALFIGDVGRTDFYPRQKEQVAALLYESIFNKLLPLGDGVILYPAHGAGSVCGAGLADREFSTLGYERLHNPRLQMSRKAFIKFKQEEHHYIPPYFEKMEQVNLSGSKAPQRTQPERTPPNTFKRYLEASEWQVIDIRSVEACIGAFIPGALALPVDMFPAFAGWFLSYEKKLAVIYETPEELSALKPFLLRQGFPDIASVLAGGMTAWETQAEHFESFPVVTVQELCQKQKNQESFTLLDVRSLDEYASDHLDQAVHIYLGHLPQEYENLKRAQEIITFCGSGKRALIAASILKQRGFKQVSVCLGSMKAWKNAQS